WNRHFRYRALDHLRRRPRLRSYVRLRRPEPDLTLNRLSSQASHRRGAEVHRDTQSRETGKRYPDSHSSGHCGLDVFRIDSAPGPLRNLRVSALNISWCGFTPATNYSPLSSDVFASTFVLMLRYR